jgi:hypothetical protein
MAEWGAFGFGVVLGWFAYFTNRYRKSDVQFSDLTTLVGVIGGGAITALFGEGKTALFGAYGVGLAVGFFAYFLVLLVMVTRSNGVFTVTWFLDGRRKRLADDEVIPGETRPTVAPMAVQLGGPQQAMAAPAVLARSPLAVAVEERDRATAAMADALRELMRRIGDTTDDAQRARLRETQVQLTQKYDELVALRLKDVLESESVRSALAKLNMITADLVAGAQEMKTAADTLATAAKMIDRATKAIGFIGAIFA